MRRRPLLTSASALLTGPALARTAPPSAGSGRKVLHLALASPETTLDPVQTNSDGNTMAVLSHIFEAPLAYDYLARPARLVRSTAAAMPEVSADGREFTVRLRPGIHFSDHPAFQGRPRELTAHDHLYAIKRFFDPRWNSSDLYLYESLQIPGMADLRRAALSGGPGGKPQPFDYDRPVAGLRALDRYTLRITLGVPDPRFIYLMADPVFMGAVAREVVEHHGDDIGAHPIGTGAFRLAQWRRGSRLVLERSPTHRGLQYEGTPADDPLAQSIAQHLKGRTLPLVDEVVLDVMEESQPRWLSFLDGTLNWMVVPAAYRDLAAPGGQLAPYLARRGVRLQRALQPSMAMSFFQMEDPVVGGYTPQKVALRRAIGLAFDGDAYLRHVLGGSGIKAHSAVPPHTSGYERDFRSEMALHDPARARALLDLHGYVDRDGDGWREGPDGAPLELRMAGTATLNDRRLHEVWKRSLDAVGLRIRFEVASWPELLKKSRAGTLMMWGYTWSATSPDGGFFLAIAYGPNASESNDARFALPAFDRLFERQRVLPDGPERAALMHEAKKTMVAWLPYKVLAHHEYLDVVQPWTRGYWRHPFMRDVWRFVDVDPTPG